MNPIPTAGVLLRLRFARPDVLPPGGRLRMALAALGVDPSRVAQANARDVGQRRGNAERRRLGIGFNTRRVLPL